MSFRKRAIFGFLTASVAPGIVTSLLIIKDGDYPLDAGKAPLNQHTCVKGIIT